MKHSNQNTLRDESPKQPTEEQRLKEFHEWADRLGQSMVKSINHHSTKPSARTEKQPPDRPQK